MSGPVPVQPSGVTGITPVQGVRYTQEPEAPPEVVHGGPADPAHGRFGEQAVPYSWQSQLTNYAGFSGPYGQENGLLDEPSDYYGDPAGRLGQNPYGDQTPYRGHAAPANVTLSGPLPSQYDAVNFQLVQGAENRSVDLGASRSRTLTRFGDAQQDAWTEIWDVTQDHDLYGPAPAPVSVASGGYGTNDRTSNILRKENRYGFDEGHHHRRYANGSIPGNYMWMRPGSRPLVKHFAGVSRPATGPDSPFTGDDIGATFGIQGAVLQVVPSEYQSPPSPQLAAPVNYDTPPPGIALW